ncbi:APC amino acid permease [Hymenopellis radicata]|nr:APC amino acid permease [Hymenopellis radicata]
MDDEAPLLLTGPDYGATKVVVASGIDGAAVHREGDTRNGEAFDDVPHAKRQLGLFSAVVLIFNRIIGTGIFATPSVILRSSGSVGVALLMWLTGATIAAVGTTVYIELGTGLPRSGGEKNYLEYIYRHPKFLATCAFSVYAVITGSSSANSLVFSEYLLNAFDVPPTRFNTRLVAFLCLTFCATVHGTHVRFGLRLQNSLGIFKLFLLGGIGLTGLCSLFGLLHVPSPHNFEHMWEGSRGDVSALVVGLYNVIWSFVGYSTANYALSEVRNPVWTIKRAAPIALVGVTAVYMLVNVAYFAVVSKEDILGSKRIVAALFFRNLFGSNTERILSAFISLSTLGNLLSGQFSQGRVIQELGREGVLPFAAFFSSNKPFNAPLAALVTQWFFSCTFVILPPPGDAYLFMISLSSYSLAIINTLVSFGLLLLYARPEWDPPFRAPKPVVVAFFLSNVFLVVVPFVPPKEGGGTYEHLPYWAHAVTAFAVSFIGLAYWYVWCRWLPRWKGYRLQREWVLQDDGVSRCVFQKMPIEDR